MKYFSIFQHPGAEASELAVSFLAIVAKHDPQVMGVKPFYDLLKALEPQLSLLTTPRIAHPLTPDIQKDIRRANELSLAIVTQLKAVEQSKLEAYKAPFLLISPLAKQYLTKNYKSTREKFNDKTRNFLDAANKTEEMRNAAKALGIDVFISELGVVKSRIDQNDALRSEYSISRRAVKEMQLRKALNKAMSDLLKAIELAKVTNKTFDFGPFDTELGVLFTVYRSKLRSRSTRRLNNVLKKESAATTAKSVATETLENGLI
jgi:hypothetical protein